MHKITRLLIASFFAAIMFITRFFVPPPFDSLLIAVDAVLLALSALFVKKIGATYVAAVGGALVALWRPSFVPFSLIFLLVYGCLVDFFLFLFGVNATVEGVNRNRLMLAMAFNTLIIGFLTYFTFTTFPTLVPNIPALTMIVAFLGPVTGACAGYASAYLWNKYLRTMIV